MDMLYLASRSPRRKRLLRRLRRTFRVVPSSFKETIRRGDTPSQNARRNAAGKALKARLPSRARGTVIGADTFLYFRGRILGKPRDLREAKRFLRELSGRSHWVYTGVCVRRVPEGRMRLSHARTRVTFRRLTDAFIDDFHARIGPLDKAGAYAIQEDRGRLIARVDGSLTNVIGLPLELLRRELALLRRQLKSVER
jgi:septum formation protein